MTLEERIDAARRRLHEYINRAIGQKLRRLRERDAAAGRDPVPPAPPAAK